MDAEKYYSKSLNSPPPYSDQQGNRMPPGKTLLVCEQPFEVYNQLVISVRPEQALNTNYAHTADIHPQ
ncbi:MAG: hypothetical protein IPI30_04075 [Saprospiraceae bacterium]|nr:hypothetical protein [Candidatus Vicinibacter affinis]